MNPVCSSIQTSQRKNYWNGAIVSHGRDPPSCLPSKTWHRSRYDVVCLYDPRVLKQGNMWEVVLRSLRPHCQHRISHHQTTPLSDPVPPHASASAAATTSLLTDQLHPLRGTSHPRSGQPLHQGVVAIDRQRGHVPSLPSYPECVGTTPGGLEPPPSGFGRPHPIQLEQCRHWTTGGIRTSTFSFAG